MCFGTKGTVLFYLCYDRHGKESGSEPPIRVAREAQTVFLRRNRKRRDATIL